MATIGKRTTFCVEEDLLLLRDVLHYNPFLRPDEWIQIASRMSTSNKVFSTRGIRDRLQYLLAQFKKEDGLNKRRSGTEEQVNELTQLLQEILDLQREFGKNKKPKTSAAFGVDARNEAALVNAYSLIEEYEVDTPDPVSTPSPPLPPPPPSVPSSSPLSSELLSPPMRKGNNGTPIQRKNANYLQHVQERQRKDREIEVRRLDIEEKKLEMEKEKIEVEKEKIELEKKKFDFECEMRRNELEMQRKEREARLEQDRVQMRFMATLAQHIMASRESK